uniref:Uncharacterized protein n=1 Tax=Cacopsylla melanoneura TaxID=428564 RepID=A0A8D8R610_9HEMI
MTTLMSTDGYTDPIRPYHGLEGVIRIITIIIVIHRLVVRVLLSVVKVLAFMNCGSFNLISVERNKEECWLHRIGIVFIPSINSFFPPFQNTHNILVRYYVFRM